MQPLLFSPIAIKEPCRDLADGEYAAFGGVAPQPAEDILQQGRADAHGSGREASLLAAGGGNCPRPVEVLHDWPIEYGWRRKHREWAYPRIRADSVVNSGEISKERRQ
jgi:hypothetical protein